MSQQSSLQLSTLQEIEGFLGLRESAFLGLRNGLSTATKRDLHILLRGIDLLWARAKDEPDARWEFYRLAGFLGELLASDGKHSLCGQLEGAQFWLARMSRKSAVSLDAYAGNIRGLMKAIKPHLDPPTSPGEMDLGVVCPIDPSDDMRQWTVALKRYRRELVELRSRLEKFSRKCDPQGDVYRRLIARLTEAAGDPPDMVDDKCLLFLRDLYRWHLKVVRQALRQWNYLPRNSEGIESLLACLRPERMLVEVSPFLGATLDPPPHIPFERIVLEGEHRSARQVVPALYGRLTQSAVADMSGLRIVGGPVRLNELEKVVVGLWTVVTTVISARSRLSPIAPPPS